MAGPIPLTDLPNEGPRRRGAPVQFWERWVALWERWLVLRDRLLASPAFQRWATSNPLTRPIARRRARELFDLVAGFVYSQVLAACVQLRLFEILAEGPQTAAQLAQRLALPEDATGRLLAAAAALRLVESRRRQRFGLGVLGAPLVDNPALAAMIGHHAALYADLRDPVALLRGAVEAPALGRYWPYAAAAAPDRLHGDAVAEYSALMSASQPLVADQILDAYPIARHRCLLDVGGGEGNFLIAAARRAPRLQLQLFDLPAVAARARIRLDAHGVGPRAQVVGGNFLRDALPLGADLATLVRVVHDHDDARALAILRAVRTALPPGGVLLLAEPMSATPGAEAMGDAYFGFYLLAMGKGRPRSAAQLDTLVRSAGFTSVRLLATRMPLQTRVLVAQVARTARTASTSGSGSDPASGLP